MVGAAPKRTRVQTRVPLQSMVNDGQDRFVQLIWISKKNKNTSKKRLLNSLRRKLKPNISPDRPSVLSSRQLTTLEARLWARRLPSWSTTCCTSETVLLSTRTHVTSTLTTRRKFKAHKLQLKSIIPSQRPHQHTCPNIWIRKSTIWMPPRMWALITL